MIFSFVWTSQTITIARINSFEKYRAKKKCPITHTTGNCGQNSHIINFCVRELLGRKKSGFWFLVTLIFGKDFGNELWDKPAFSDTEKYFIFISMFLQLSYSGVSAIVPLLDTLRADGTYDFQPVNDSPVMAKRITYRT